MRERVEVALGVETATERAHAQVRDSGRLALLQDLQPLGLGTTVDSDPALRTDLAAS